MSIIARIRFLWTILPLKAFPAVRNGLEIKPSDLKRVVFVASKLEMVPVGALKRLELFHGSFQGQLVVRAVGGDLEVRAGSELFKMLQLVVQAKLRGLKR